MDNLSLFTTNFMEHHDTRILAIDPGTRYMGVAVLQGHDLLYYTVKDLRRQRPADALIRSTRKALLELIRHYRPAVLAYEKTFYVQQKTSAVLHVQELEIARVGQAEKLKVVGYSPALIRKMLCEDGRATKQAVAHRLAERFPELVGYRFPTQWRRRAYWLNMFDAVAVGVICADRLDAPEATISDAA